MAQSHPAGASPASPIQTSRASAVGPRDADTVSPALAGSIFATAVLAFLGLFLETVMSVLFPAIMTDFGIGTSDVQWLTSGYLLVVSVIMPISGYLQRRFRAKSLFLVAASAVAVGALAAMVAPTFPVLLAARLFQGVGTGIVTPLMFTIILTQAPRSKTGALMGVGGLTLGVAPAVGPVVGGVIGQVSSWRMVFALTLPFVLAALIVGVRSIQQTRPTERIRLNVAHVALLALGFVGLILGLERGGALLAASSSGSPASAGQIALVVGLLAVGVLSGIGFLIGSRRSTNPILRLSVLYSPVYRNGLAAFSLLQFVALGLGYLIPNLSQLAFGSSSMTAGLLVLPGAVVGAVLAPIAGSLYDRFGPAVPISIGGVLALVATVTLAIIGADLTSTVMAVVYLLFMFGFGLAYTNTQTLGMSGVERSLTTDGTSLMNTVQQFFGAMSMTVLSTVLAMNQAGTQAGTPAYAVASARGGAICFTIVAGVVAAACFFEYRGLVAVRRRAAEAAAADAELGIDASVTRLLDTPVAGEIPVTDAPESAGPRDVVDAAAEPTADLAAR
ncbi:MFS transporter [Actinomyces sp. MRS3W]|uniref:MFS transporter n=1 Tax=Actinomyces sp. MRS3W TaxID=2800796 RepID=UPI0028FD4DD0|nr:MFS transporter [Actinomyces sp. MRS3W]MDU0347330.1 MFS transporter [Actinomyces sp. MRS3W]